MEAVVYTSNTGSTEHYAKLLGHELSVSVYSTEEAGNKLPAGTEIIYLGWIMAGKIQGYGLARKKYKICAVCAVGMGQTGTQRKEIREKNSIPGKIPVFTLQGNFSVERLDEHYGEDSRKSSGEESRSNSGRRGYAGYDAAWWRTCQDTEPAGRD